jgi:S1-C subfamily serine protease
MTSLVALTLLILAQGPAPSPSPTDRPAGAPAPIDVVAALESALADAIARAEPSIVSIHRHKGANPNETLAVRGRKRAIPIAERDPLEFPMRPIPEDFISFDYGSGVVIGGKGEILTAFHVVRGADQLVVSAAGGQLFAAEVIAADPRSDLAVITPVAQPGVDRPRLRPIQIGDSSKLRKGTFLVALGNPFNAARADGSPSASWGILANTARRLDGEIDSSGFTRKGNRLMNFPTLLQLDAKLNLGMSGGAVINLKGELVGLTTTASSPAGFDAQAGYAIPMDPMGRRAVESLRQGKEVEYGLLGIQADQRFTNRVGQVTPHSPAARGQLQMNDEVLAVNGVPVTNFDTLILAVGPYSPGDAVKLKIRRGDDFIERTIVLAKYPVEGEVIATNRPPAWRGLRVDYTSALRLSALAFPDMDVTAAGVVVTDVEEGSPAASAGLKKGVVILKVRDRPLHSPRAFAEAVDGQDGSVALETDIGVLTVGNGESSRPKASEPPTRGR